MRVLFINYEAGFGSYSGGISSYIKNIAAAITARGHEAFVLGGSYGYSTKTEIVEGITYIRVGSLVPIFQGSSFLSLILNRIFIEYRRTVYRKKVANLANKLVRNELIDVIEVADFGNDLKYANDLIWKRTVVRFHGLVSIDRGGGYIDLNNKHTLSSINSALKADYWSFPSRVYMKLILDYLTKVGFENKVKEYVQITNSVAKCISDGNTLEVRSNKILFVGSLVETKGIWELVQAFDEMDNADWELHIIGAGNSVRKQIIKRFGSNERIILRGTLPNLEVINEYKNSKILCQPSWWENQSMTILEGMSSGCIVVASDCDGNKEIIEDKKTGILFRKGSTSDLKSKLEQAIFLSSNQCNDYRDCAYNVIKNDFNLNSNIERVLKLYSNICGCK